MIPRWLHVSEEVAVATAVGRPVVALESTLIAHGLPWPANLETAPGGSGGAPRDEEHPWDISAALTELGRTPVLVVCAGAKSILDLPRTLEILETLGVPVVGYRTDTFPTFYVAGGAALPVSVRVET